MNNLNVDLLNQINNGFHPVQAIDFATIALIVLLVVAIIAAVLAILLVPNAYDPRSAGDIQRTQQELDIPITVVYGRVKIRSATRLSIMERVYEPITAASKK